eukprot:Gb_24205 [translate_table: standard]
MGDLARWVVRWCKCSRFCHKGASGSWFLSPSTKQDQKLPNDTASVALSMSRRFVEDPYRGRGYSCPFGVSIFLGILNLLFFYGELLCLRIGSDPIQLLPFGVMEASNSGLMIMGGNGPRDLFPPVLKIGGWIGVVGQIELWLVLPEDSAQECTMLLELCPMRRCGHYSSFPCCSFSQSSISMRSSSFSGTRMHRSLPSFLMARRGYV